ncbi:sulfurtransferase TusA family protein [Pseudalkalibacillus sp. A8]|uniref:sulfurtransferase TusA family protein n=1 Tax=Pseudalkalibacillus sp. A8 TaxID=3382641 RepID=UPI0038B6A72D
MMKTDKVLDAKGLACPMPIVKTKKTIGEIEAGQVLEVQATDKGSTADIASWAKSAGHQYLGTKDEEDVLKHYLRKASPEEAKEETIYPNVIRNDELKSKLDEGGTVLDVREPAEYAFNRIPGAVSIPLGELERRLDELDRDDDIYVVCRTGNRSDRASQLLADKGFSKVKNVVPGMSHWDGPTEKED